MQGRLFDLSSPDMPPVKHLAHAGDPATSHEAAAKHDATGARLRNADTVLELVRAYRGNTAIELWHLASEEQQATLKEPQEVRRRLHDLAHCLPPRVRKGAARKCTVRATLQVVWEVVPHA